MASAARSLRGSRRALTLAAVSAVSAAPAAAQLQPPSLTADTTFAFQGVSQYDFSAGVQEDVGLAAAADDARGRTYAAGYTQVAGATRIAIVARRTDGSLDPAFAGDGSLELTQGRASLATDLAVLPDGRLRVLIRFDSASSGPPVYEVGTRRPAAGRIGPTPTTAWSGSTRERPRTSATRSRSPRTVGSRWRAATAPTRSCGSTAP